MKKLFLLLALLAAAALPCAAQSKVQYNQNAGTNAAFTVQFASTTTHSNAIIAIASWKPNNGGIPTGVPTDSEGNTYTQDGAALNSGTGEASIQLWHAFGIVGGTLDTVTYHNDGGATVEFQIAELAGVDTVDQINRTATGTSTSPTTGSITTTQASAFILAATALNPAASAFYSAGDAGFTDIGGGTGGTYYTQYKVVSSTGTYSAASTVNSSSEWVAWISSYYHNAGGGGGGGGGGTAARYVQNPGRTQSPGSTQTPGAVQSPGKTQAPF